MNSHVYQYFIKQNKFHNVLNMYLQYENGLRPTDFKKNCVFKFIEDTLSQPGHKNYNYLLQNYAFLKPYLSQWIASGASGKADATVTWTSADKISRMMMHRLCAFYGLEHNIDMSNPERIVIEYEPRTCHQWAASLEEWAEFLGHRHSLETTGTTGGSGNTGSTGGDKRGGGKVPALAPCAYCPVPGMPGYVWRAPPTIIIYPIPAGPGQMINVPIQYAGAVTHPQPALQPPHTN